MKTGRYLAVCVVSLAWGGMATGTVLHVSSGGAGRYTSIQDAINAAVSGRDKIEVAPGTYYEAIDFHGKAVRLYSKSGPAVTIINGTGNYHVVRCVGGEGPDTILEGFTITGGNARGTALEDTWGGGMYTRGADPTVKDCLFTGNSALNGGGMFNAGSPTLTNCTFKSNSADRGGGIFDGFGGQPSVTDCTFQNNQAAEGGGICNGMMSYAIVTNCTFTANAATGAGGGMSSIQGGGDAIGCAFVDNVAAKGGGIYYGDSGGTVSNCTFHHNRADSGGAMGIDVSGPRVINCLFTANAASGQGGAMANMASDPVVTHCTFAGNTAGISAGAILSTGAGSTTTVTNCILWGDVPGEIDSHYAAFVVTYSDIQGGGFPDPTNKDADPLFAEADYRPLPDSPCIDAGTNSPAGGLPATDIAGNPRSVDGNDDGIALADMGAYEWPSKAKEDKP